MTILELLEAHGVVWDANKGKLMCSCHEHGGGAGYRAHLAEVLEAHTREREAAALEEAASEREHHEYQVNPWRTDTTVEQKRESASFLMQSTSSWLRDRAKQVRATL